MSVLTGNNPFAEYKQSVLNEGLHDEKIEGLKEVDHFWDGGGDKPRIIYPLQLRSKGCVGVANRIGADCD